MEKELIINFKERMRIRNIERDNKIYDNISLDELIGRKNFYENNIRELKNMNKSEYYTLLNHSNYGCWRGETWDYYLYTPK